MYGYVKKKSILVK